MKDDYPQNMLADIEAYLAEDEKRTVGQDAYPEIFSTRAFFPLQRQRELAAMMRVARSINPVVMMEIGADKGGGLYHWCKCLPTVKHVVACEIRGTPYADLFEQAFDPDGEGFPDGIEFLWLPRDSQLSLSLVKPWLARRYGGMNDPFLKIDCLFIDGDKTAFEQDFDAYLPLMNPKGIMFMHDVQDREPKTAFEKVVNRGYRHDIILDQTESWEAMARERAGVPPASAHEAWLRHWKGKSCGVGVIYLDKELSK